MMVIRPVAHGDLAGLMQLAGKTGGGLTSLPADEKTLSARIERALQTWQGTLPKSEQGYVFVLEETDTGTVAGFAPSRWPSGSTIRGTTTASARWSTPRKS